MLFLTKTVFIPSNQPLLANNNPIIVSYPRCMMPVCALYNRSPFLAMTSFVVSFSLSLSSPRHFLFVCLRKRRNRRPCSLLFIASSNRFNKSTCSVVAFPLFRLSMKMMSCVPKNPGHHLSSSLCTSICPEVYNGLSMAKMFKHNFQIKAFFSMIISAVLFCTFFFLPWITCEKTHAYICSCIDMKACA